jgi:hypothetical protein
LEQEPQLQVQPLWVQQLVQPVSAQQAPQREPQASVVQQQVPQVQELSPPVQRPDAYARPSLPHPWRLYPPWPWLLPPLPRPLLPEYVPAPSPQHPREWSSSAFSFR